MSEVGATVGQKYRVLAKLGEGSMGAVFQAQNLLTGKQVALKFLPMQSGANADAVSRLLREARVLSRFSHPNVVDVYDIIVEPDRIFLVLELLHGETLTQYCLRRRNLKISQLIQLLLPAMSGISAAHGCGVLHRDLKPDNIFLARVDHRAEPLTKVLDFGVAKLLAAPEQTLTDTGATVGTPLYMSLEQLRGDKNIDVRADIYAIGVVLYELIAGRRPYTANTLPELAMKVATTDAPPLKTLRPEVPAKLARVIDSALARDRERRPRDIQSLQRELAAFTSEAGFADAHADRALHARPSGPRPSAADDLTKTTILSRHKPPLPTRHMLRGWSWIPLGLAAAAIMLLALWLVGSTEESVVPASTLERAVLVTEPSRVAAQIPEPALVVPQDIETPSPSAMPQAVEVAPPPPAAIAQPAPRSRRPKVQPAAPVTVSQPKSNRELLGF